MNDRYTDPKLVDVATRCAKMLGRILKLDTLAEKEVYREVMEAIVTSAMTRAAIIEECAKVADHCEIMAKQTYGVSESVGAHMAARSIRRLAGLAPSALSSKEGLADG